MISIWHKHWKRMQARAVTIFKSKMINFDYITDKNKT